MTVLEFEAQLEFSVHKYFNVPKRREDLMLMSLLSASRSQAMGEEASP